ncbi:hypothetical protein K492DRAFT_176376 [Lichtheimia hyalospora FSU 10163]|nr:hypothetical protein K492DRAFT_176376 [Lichtheimia hyalospora FSU 10163]
MAVIVNYQELVSPTAFFFLVDTNFQASILMPSTSQYLHIYLLAKIWIICACAICDA